eukprot:PLAT5937.1.p2 GENE.PLAT5937.1~~PLAT5937.1.p2  ORF type:complete len:237 (-),score=70.38 PLAT5937.1:24-734(-)
MSGKGGGGAAPPPPPPPPAGGSGEGKGGKKFEVNVVHNVMGSVAGSGSGDFHLYRHQRNRELARMRKMDAEHARELKKIAFEAALQTNKRSAEERTRKRADKRKRRKQKKAEKKRKLAAAEGKTATDSFTVTMRPAPRQTGAKAAGGAASDGKSDADGAEDSVGPSLPPGMEESKATEAPAVGAAPAAAAAAAAAATPRPGGGGGGMKRRMAAAGRRPAVKPARGGITIVDDDADF